MIHLWPGLILKLNIRKMNVFGQPLDIINDFVIDIVNNRKGHNIVKDKKDATLISQTAYLFLMMKEGGNIKMSVPYVKLFTFLLFILIRQ